MNHDYAHCLDFQKSCPASCFRAKLSMDLEKHREEYIKIPLTWSFLGKLSTVHWVIATREMGMTEEEARVVIRSEPYTNVRMHLEAIRKAEEVLGEDATLEQIWIWAEKGVVEDEIHSSTGGGNHRDPVS